MIPWRQPWLKWLLLLLLWTVFGLASACQQYLLRSKIGLPVTWGYALEKNFADWYAWALLSIPALWLARRLPIERHHWLRNLAAHLLGGAAFSFGWMALRAGLEEWLTRNDIQPVTFAAAFSHALAATFFLNLLIYWAAVLAQHALSYYTKFRERELHAVELESRLTQARLQALQMQLNPHFLFNTLNAISALVRKDADAADRMITRLSELLRYTLASTDTQEVPLRQEIDFLGRYLEIQQARFGPRLSIRHEIADETLDGLVPNLVLQPLVENAIEHGITPHARPGEIVLRAVRRGEELELAVQDNGGGLLPNRPVEENVGLGNTRARLQQLYGSRQRLELLNGAQGGLTVRITVPWRVESRAST